MRQKWASVACYVFYTVRLLEAAFLVSIVRLGFTLKQQPAQRHLGLAALPLALAMLLLVFELLSMIFWWRNDTARAFESLAGFKRKLQGLIPWSSAFSWFAKVLAYVAVIGACIYYILNLGAGAHTTETDAPLYAALGFASYVSGKALIGALCVSPHLPRVGVHVLIIDKMLMNDFSYYLTFLLAFLVNYFLAMYILFPATADDPQPKLVTGRERTDGTGTFDMRYPMIGFNAMVEFAIFGIRFAPNANAPELDDLSYGEMLCFALFSALTYVFTLVCLILLVRLLMAMMTNTFRKVQEQAQLEWRLLIARNVLRLELFVLNTTGKWAYAKMFAGSQSAVDGKYYHNFLHVSAPPGEPKSVPMMLAMSGTNELFNEDDDGAQAVTAPQSSGGSKSSSDAGDEGTGRRRACSGVDTPSARANEVSNGDGRAGTQVPREAERAEWVEAMGVGDEARRVELHGAGGGAHPLAALSERMSAEGIELVATFMRSLVDNPGANRRLLATERPAMNGTEGVAGRAAPDQRGEGKAATRPPSGRPSTRRLSEYEAKYFQQFNGADDERQAPEQLSA